MRSVDEAASAPVRSRAQTSASTRSGEWLIGKSVRPEGAHLVFELRKRTGMQTRGRFHREIATGSARSHLPRQRRETERTGTEPSTCAMTSATMAPPWLISANRRGSGAALGDRDHRPCAPIGSAAPGASRHRPAHRGGRRRHCRRRRCRSNCIVPVPAERDRRRRQCGSSPAPISRTNAFGLRCGSRFQSASSRSSISSPSISWRPSQGAAIALGEVIEKARRQDAPGFQPSRRE